ncbi:hypothetical protein SNEBB_010811 [Seison nebaliae]|nr:hypothetical protein SNEBB_010811 [Seison nebaliae]
MIKDNFMDIPSMDMDFASACSLGNIGYLKEMINDKKSMDGERSRQELNELINYKNLRNWTPLMYASYYGEDKVVKSLLENGADIRGKNDDNRTAFLLAAYFGHERIIEMMIKKSKNKETLRNLINDLDRWHSNSFHYICENAEYECLELLLPTKLCSLNILNNQYYSALMLAIDCGCETTISILFDYLDEFYENDLKSLYHHLNYTTINGIHAISLCEKNDSIRTVVIDYIQAHNKNYETYLMETNQSPDGDDGIVIDNLTSLKELFQKLNLMKYYVEFQKNDIDLKNIGKLNENNLRKFGMNLIGPRKKLLSIIQRLP